MTAELVQRAAYNNALWCEAICRAHGYPGEFQQALWLNRLGTPRYYPDVVTIAGADAASVQMRVIAALCGASHGRGWAVKDSFASLDLSGLGFRLIFEAEWIGCYPSSATAGLTGGYDWHTITTDADLMVWERAWNGGDMPEALLFKPSLLADPDIIFLAASSRGEVIGGGILNLGGDVVGLSNVFTRKGEPESVWRGLIHHAARKCPNLPIAGYERGDELAAARRCGFAGIGPLRVWGR